MFRHLRTAVLPATVLLLGLGAILGASRPAPAQPAPAPAPGKRVVVYMYSEYIDPVLLEQFEKQTGMPVKIVTYEASEEMLAKVSQAGGDAEFDVLVVSDVVVPALIRRGIARPLDLGKLPNAANVAAEFKDPPFDPGSKHSLPYQWGTVGLIFRKDKVPAQDLSWSVLFDPGQQPGRLVLMDSMRDMLGIALRYLGKSMNTTELAEVKAAGDLLAQTKNSRYFVGFEGGVGGKAAVIENRASLAVCYNGDAVKAILEGKKQGEVAFAVPREGGVIWTDVMLVTRRGPNPDGAHKFLDFILDPRNGAALSNFNHYATPNQASLALIDKDDQANPAIYPPAEIRRKLEYLHDLGVKTRLYDEVWTAVKSR